MTGNGIPHRLRTFYVAISEFPSTNGIKVLALFLIVVTGVLLAVASMKSADISEGVLTIWLSALLAMLGVGAWQSNKKWEMPKPPIEDTSAVHGTPDAPIAAKPAFTRVVAQQVADATKPPMDDIP